VNSEPVQETQAVIGENEKIPKYSRRVRKVGYNYLKSNTPIIGNNILEYYYSYSFKTGELILYVPPIAIRRRLILSMFLYFVSNKMYFSD